VFYQFPGKLLHGKVKYEGTLLIKERTNKVLECVMGRVVWGVEWASNVVITLSNVFKGDDEALLHALIHTFRRIGITGLQTYNVGYSGRSIDALVLQIQELLHDYSLLLATDIRAESEGDKVLNLTLRSVHARDGKNSGYKADGEHAEHGHMSEERHDDQYNQNRDVLGEGEEETGRNTCPKSNERNEKVPRSKKEILNDSALGTHIDWKIPSGGREHI
jgi:hypothetical protein